jgi:hypothetical protein
MHIVIARHSQVSYFHLKLVLKRLNIVVVEVGV